MLRLRDGRQVERGLFSETEGDCQNAVLPILQGKPPESKSMHKLSGSGDVPDWESSSVLPYSPIQGEHCSFVFSRHHWWESKTLSIKSPFSFFSHSQPQRYTIWINYMFSLILPLRCFLSLFFMFQLGYRWTCTRNAPFGTVQDYAWTGIAQSRPWTNQRSRNNGRAITSARSPCYPHPRIR